MQKSLWEIMKYLELNDCENLTLYKFWNAAKAILKVQFISFEYISQKRRNTKFFQAKHSAQETGNAVRTV